MDFPCGVTNVSPAATKEKKKARQSKCDKPWKNDWFWVLGTLEFIILLILLSVFEIFNDMVYFKKSSL